MRFCVLPFYGGVDVVHFRVRVNCPIQRTTTSLSTVEINISFPPWISSYLSDILFCPGYTCGTQTRGGRGLYLFFVPESLTECSYLRGGEGGGVAVS